MFAKKLILLLQLSTQGRTQKVLCGLRVGKMNLVGNQGRDGGGRIGNLNLFHIYIPLIIDFIIEHILVLFLYFQIVGVAIIL